MSGHFWLTDEQMERLWPFFPKSRGKLRVDTDARPRLDRCLTSPSQAAAITHGGSGGGAGQGGDVTAVNDGLILTSSEAADGMLVQSIGGGGGRAGGAAGSNSGTILTFGADAAGILAQSIGGGGWIANTSGTYVAVREARGSAAPWA